MMTKMKTAIAGAVAAAVLATTAISAVPAQAQPGPGMERHFDHHGDWRWRHGYRPGYASRTVYDLLRAAWLGKRS